MKYEKNVFFDGNVLGNKITYDNGKTTSMNEDVILLIKRGDFSVSC